METLSIFTFGGFKVLQGDQPVHGFETRKVEALIAYLACNPGFHSREILADLLWDERSQQQAGTNLRVALTGLRKVLSDYFVIARETVALNPQAPVWVDAVELSRCMANRPGPDTGVQTAQQAESIENAVNLYRGDFLAGFSIRDSRGFEDWQARERERLHQLALDGLHDLVEFYLKTGAYRAGMAHAARLLELDPLLESAHRQKMQLLARSGRRSEAFAQYDLLKRLLWDELGVGPSPATEALIDKIRSGEVGEDLPESGLLRGYAIQEKIGSGSYGEVYRATQPSVGREVAIKVILPQYANDPEFIRRFEAEAQIIARLEHPNVVPLYDFWREPGRAYLVMRYLRGGNLAQELARGPLELKRALPVLEQVAPALQVAHHQKIIHRDLKPENILLDDAGNAYISDFGIAKDLGVERTRTAEGALIGSPAYMSPEQIQGLELTPQSDIYSLGVLLYELLAGKPPFSGSSVVAVLEKQLNERLPALKETRPDLPAAVDRVIERATAKDPGGRFPDVLSFLAAFQSALSTGALPASPQATWAGLPPSNPYKGLRPFRETDADDFFGREQSIEKLLARLADGTGRFLAVVGPSGSGKSSLVHAGLTPALRKGAIPGSEKWFIVDMTPGVHPLEELEGALLRVAVNPPDSLLRQLQEDERGLLRAVKRVLPGSQDSELVLLIDQFEEVFTHVEDLAERRFFLDSLCKAILDPRSRFRLVLTLRADFYDQPLLYSGFGQLVRQHTEVVLPLTTAELLRAIQEPAERAGVRLEDGLAARIVADVKEGPGILPLLQYSLTELFERAQDGCMTLAVYQEIGGVAGALSRRAEELYSGMDPGGQEAARQLFLRLVTPGEGTGDTRRRARYAELASIQISGLASRSGTPGEDGRDEGARQAPPVGPASTIGPASTTGPASTIGPVIDVFGRYRLLSFDRDPATREPVVEVAHEALLREWARLRGWLNEHREDLRYQRRLAGMAQDWIQAGREASFLLRGSRLDQFQQWASATSLSLTADEAAYLEGSLAEKESQQAVESARQMHMAALEARSRKVLQALVIVLLLATSGSLALAVLARQSQLTAQSQARARATQQAIAETSFTRAEAQRLAAEANSLFRAGGSVELIALLSIRSVQTLYTPQGEAALQQAGTLTYPQKALLGHTDRVLDVAFSPDGARLVTAGSDNTARIWDRRTGEVVLVLSGHQGRVRAAVFSPDGRFVLTASEDKTAMLWDARSGAAIRSFTGHENQVWGAAFSPDGRNALTASLDKTARIWDVQTGEEIRQVSGHRDGLTSLAASPGGALLLTGSLDKTARLWDIQTGREVQTFSGHTGQVNSVAFSPDGTAVLTGSFDKTARLWDRETGAEIRSFTGHEEFIIQADFSPGGEYVLTSGSDDVTARLWETATGREIRRFAGHTSYVTGVAFSPDGEAVATASYDKTALVWDLNERAFPPILLGHTGDLHQVVFSPDGKFLLTGAFDGSARLWDVQTGEMVRVFSANTAEIHGVAYSPDGKYILTGGFDKTARLWDASTGAELRQFVGHAGKIDGVAFSSDGRYAITSSENPDPDTRVWDVQTGEQIQVLKGHSDRVHSIAVSPDGSYILTGSDDKTSRLWDTLTGKPLRTLQIPDGAVSVAFSPDGRLILTGGFDHQAHIWSTETGEELLQFVGHTDTVKSAVFSPDGRYVLTGGTDETARLWDAQTGKELRRFSGHTGVINGVAYSPGGELIATASSDQTARIWYADTADLVRTLCSRLVRDLSPGEREAYEILDTAPTCP